MQTEEDKQFQINSKVLLMAFIVLTALAAPIAIVAVAFTDSPRNKKNQIAPGINPEATASMTSALEELAAESLQPTSLSFDQKRLEIFSSDVSSEVVRIQDVAKNFNSFSLLPQGEGTEVVRLLVSVPTGQMELFLKACRDPAAQVVPEGSNGNPSRELVEIVVQKEKKP